jgi:hypothetical protein
MANPARLVLIGHPVRERRIDSGVRRSMTPATIAKKSTIQRLAEPEQIIRHRLGNTVPAPVPVSRQPSANGLPDRREYKSAVPAEIDNSIDRESARFHERPRA